jgi:hypothetical protein
MNLKVVGVSGVTANAHLLNTILLGTNEYFLILLLVLLCPVPHDIHDLIILIIGF